MSNQFATIASRLVAAGYRPAAAADIAAILGRLAGKVGGQVNVAGGRSLTVVAVDPGAVTATFREGTATFTAGAAALGTLFGVKTTD